MSPRWLAMLTAKLIKRCGGYEEAEAFLSTDGPRPYSKSQLQRCAQADDPNWLPLDIVAALEAYANARVISGALAAAGPARPGLQDLMVEGCEAVEAAASAIAAIREALADGDISPREEQAIRARVEAGMAEYRDVLAVLDQGRAP